MRRWLGNGSVSPCPSLHRSRHQPGPWGTSWPAIIELEVPALSFTFGTPAVGLDDVVAMGPATATAEAMALEQTCVGVLVAQGAEAGGHRGTFMGPPDDALVG